MQDAVFTIKENELIAKNVYRLTRLGDTSSVTSAGQFVNVSLPGFFLRRPISVADAETGKLTLIYKTVGQGTDALARMGEGTLLSVLTGLGNGYGQLCFTSKAFPGYNVSGFILNADCAGGTIHRDRNRDAEGFIR